MSSSTLCLLAGFLALAAPSVAWSQSPAKWTLQTTAATDYVSKGISKNAEEPALSASAEASSGKWYAGAWASQASTAQGADAEVQLYAGVRPSFTGLKWDLRGYYKTLPGTARGFQEDLFEARVDAARSFGRTNLRLRLEYSPDGYAAARQTWWVEAQASRPIGERVVVSAALARREQENGAGYTAWNAGAQVALGRRLGLDLRWHDTDAHQRGDAYHGRAVAALTLRY
jgi:uncharacterized protein (TIGR02001 family)